MRTHRTATTLALIVSLAAPSLASAYVRSETELGDALFWDRRSIPWRMHVAGSDDVGLDLATDAAKRSFEQWEAVTCSDVDFGYAGLTDDDFVGFRQQGANENVVVWRESDWPHELGVIAVTTVTFCTRVQGSVCPTGGLILDADIELNGADFTFTIVDTSGASDRYDLRNTLTHEIGHLLGFGHSADQEATMFLSAPPGERKKRDLAPDDEAALCDSYPGGEPASPLNDEPTPTADQQVPTAGAGVNEEGCSATGGSGGAGWLALLVLSLGAGRCRRPAGRRRR